MLKLVGKNSFDYFPLTLKVWFWQSHQFIFCLDSIAVSLETAMLSSFVQILSHVLVKHTCCVFNRGVLYSGRELDTLGHFL